MSSLFSGSSKKQTTTQTSSPWAAQDPYLRSGFADALSAYQKRTSAGPYPGPTYVGLQPDQLTALDRMRNVSDASAPVADAFTGIGSGLLGATNNFAGNSGVLFNRSLEDPTQSNINSANQYANNPAIQGVIDSAAGDVTRNLRESALPQLNAGAAGTGNMNSSRTGSLEAGLVRDAGNRIADISSQVRGNAYQQGLGLAQQGRTSGLQLGALTNQGLLQGGQLGVDATRTGLGVASGGAQQLMGAGDTVQQDRQNVLGDQIQQYYLNNGGFDQSALNDYWNVVGRGNWGGTTTGTTSQSGGGPGILGGILGTASTLSGLGHTGSGSGGFFGGLGNLYKGATSLFGG